MSLAVSDPTYQHGTARRFGERLAMRFINDPRDLPFLVLAAVLTVTVLPTGVVLFVPGCFRWWLAAVHLALFVHFLGPYVLMLHNTSHRSLFRKSWGWMNQYIPWVLGPFFGESPETYFAHHVGMHHPENNLDADISSTLPYRRDSVRGFSRYFLRFFFFGLVELTAYFARKRRRSLMIRTAIGELLFLGTVVALLFVDWRATATVFVVPFVLARFLMMAGNWGQHAFVDQASPANSYRNSITCINCGYNRRCFNDGYHIGHHLKATRHWTELPVEFLRNSPTYAAEEAIVFAEIDFFGVWLCLMLKRYDWLARRVVQLGEVDRSMQETIALLRSRTRWVRARPAPAGNEAPPAARRANLP
jgi:fatty acid desaturase